MMKGKGKKVKDVEEKTNPQINEFKRIDLSKECPKYKEILDRNVDEECIKLEELDSLQLEIESLLVSVVYRKRQLEDEIDYSTNLQDKKDRSIKDFNKRSKHDERPNKKFKEDLDSDLSDNSLSCSDNSSLSSFTSSSSRSSFRAKTKNLSKINKFDDSFSNYNTNQNDLPNRFWKFVSTYCSPVNTKFLKMLEDLINLYENEPDILKNSFKKLNNNNYINNNNNKLTSNHINDKTFNEQQLNGNSKKDSSTSTATKSSKKSDKQKKNTLNNLTDTETTSNKTLSNKKSKGDNLNVDKCDYGILTQRLVSCLIEEDFCAENFEDIFEEISNTDNRTTGQGTINDTKLFKTLSLNNASQFERLLRKELIDHGLIDADDLFMQNDISENEEDELNQEIIKYQNELKSIMAQNQFQLKKLINIVKAEINKEELKKKLDLVNEEIIAISKRIISLKQKRKTKEIKKEKENSQKYLKERSLLLEQLNQLSINLN